MRRPAKLILACGAAPVMIGLLAGSAAAEPVESEVLFTFSDPAIHESSGLVARDGLVVTVNDSGDSNRIFTIDPASGDTVGTTRWPGDARDIEALAPAGDGHVHVGDIGDNREVRETIEVTKVPFGRGEQDVDAVSYEFTYPDGPHDAETLLVHPQTGRIHIVSKEFRGRIYTAPEELTEDGTNELIAGDDVLGVATDGAFFPDGRHLVLRNYGQAAIYTWPDLDRIAMLELPVQPQGEGIAIAEDGTVLISSEGAGSEVLRVEVPADVRAEMGPTGTASATPTPAPTQPGESSSESVPVERADERSWWPWAIGGVAGAVIVVVLLRSLRPN